MKILIASDVHGSAYYAQKLIDVYKKENVDKLILLGDLFNHGPRNPFPKDYEPMKVANMLNSVKDNLIVVKGNCDSEVDTMITEFDFLESATIIVNNKSIFLTHGHVYNAQSMPKTKFDAVIYGHFHTGLIEEKNGVIIANPGSVSLPKNDTPNSYLILEDD
jgi:putative phosphoesterase